MLLQLKAKGYKVSDEGNRDIAITDSKGNKTRLVFDENYIARKIIKPSGLEYSFEFDDDDNLSKLVFPGNEFIGMGYEKDLLKSLSLNNNRISLHYDEKQRLTELVTPDGKRNSITYNISNQVETLTNKAGETKRFETNIKDNRLLYSLRDSLGRVTKIDTDPLGSGDEIIFADGSRETTVYDEDLDAFVTTLRNGAKKVTYYEENSPSRVEWDDGNFLNLELDEQQQIKQLENPAGTVYFEYDEHGRIIEEAFQGNKVSYVYDEDGLLTQMVYPSGLVVAYDYDEDGRLKSINAGGHVCSYTYGDNDTVAEILYPNGIKEQRKQQVLGGITESVLSDAIGQTIARQSYRYDNLNRLTQYRSSDKSRSQKEKSWELSYDAQDRLLSNIESQSGKVERFTYDHKGNLASAYGNTVKVGAMDEVVSISSQNVSYDNNGNVTRFVNKQGKIVELKFSHNNELKFARVNNQTWEYWYDGIGRRVGKSNGRDAHKFFWGSEKLLAEEIKTSQGTENRQYIYGHNGSVPVGFVEGTNCFWLHADARGAVTHLSDQKGSILWSADYSSFGEAIIFNSSVSQPFRLTGQYADDETGLHYSAARYYSPLLHQFISLDPKWLEFGASNYSYALNDPFNKIDVDGNLADWVAAGIGMAASIAVGMAVAAVFPVAAAGGAGVLAFMAVGALAGALSDAITSVLEKKVKGEDICWECATKAAIIGALSGLFMGPFKNLIGLFIRSKFHNSIWRVFRLSPQQRKMSVFKTANKARNYYHTEIKRIANKIKRIKDLKSKARLAYSIRNEAKKKARKRSGPLLKDIAEKRCQWKYRKFRDPKNGPNFDELVEELKAKGLSDDEAYKEIIRKSQKTSAIFDWLSNIYVKWINTP